MRAPSVDEQVVLLHDAPFSDDQAANAACAEALLEAFTWSTEERVRLASLHGMRSDLEQEVQDRVARALERESSSAVRSALVHVLVDLDRPCSTVLEAIHRVASDVRDDTWLRRRALDTILCWERDQPGTFSEDDLERLRSIEEEILVRGA